METQRPGRFLSTSHSRSFTTTYAVRLRSGLELTPTTKASPRSREGSSFHQGRWPRPAPKGEPRPAQLERGRRGGGGGSQAQGYRSGPRSHPHRFLGSYSRAPLVLPRGSWEGLGSHALCKVPALPPVAVSRLSSAPRAGREQGSFPRNPGFLGCAHLGQTAAVLGVLAAQHLLQLVHVDPQTPPIALAPRTDLPGARPPPLRPPPTTASPAQAPAHLPARHAPRQPRPRRQLQGVTRAGPGEFWSSRPNTELAARPGFTLSFQRRAPPCARAWRNSGQALC